MIWSVIPSIKERMIQTILCLLLAMAMSLEKNTSCSKTHSLETGDHMGTEELQALIRMHLAVFVAFFRIYTNLNILNSEKNGRQIKPSLI